MAEKPRKTATKTDSKSIELQILQEAAKVADKYENASTIMIKAEATMEAFAEFAKNTKDQIISEVKDASIEAEAKKTELKQQMEEAQKAHDEKVANLDLEYSDKKAALELEYSDKKEECDQNLKKLAREHDKQIYDLNIEHRSSIDKIKADFKVKIENWWEATMNEEADKRGKKVVNNKEYHTVLTDFNALKKEKDSLFEKAWERGLNEAKDEYLNKKLKEEQEAKEEQISYKQENIKLTYEIDGLKKEIEWLKGELSKKDAQIERQVDASKEIATSYANANRVSNQQR